MLKDPTTNAGDLRDTGSILGLGRSPGNANGQPSPVFLPGESHGQRSLAGYVHRATNSQIQLKQLSTHIRKPCNPKYGAFPELNFLNLNFMKLNIT